MRLRHRIAACLCVASGAASAAESGIGDFVEAARGADIVMLGEIHDNPEHHRTQAEIVRALQPAALVFEMIPQTREGRLNELRAEGATRDEIAAALEWETSGWPDFDLYAPILEAAPEARVFGAGQPREDVERAVEAGAAAAFGPDAPKFGLDLALAADEQATREAQMAEAHCDALPPDLLPGMVEAQRFRDAGLADAALWARTTVGLDARVVVITGNGHADRQRGAPALIGLAEPEVSVVTLGQFEAPPAPAGAFDAYTLAPPPARDDPCAGLVSPGQ